VRRCCFFSAIFQVLALEVLFKCFLRHMALAMLPLHLPHRILGAVPFHDLWLKVLSALQLRLAPPRPRPAAAGSRHAQGPPAEDQARRPRSPHGGSAPGGAASPRSPLRRSGAEIVHAAAVEYLKATLLTICELGGFIPGDHTVGRELWEFTWTVLQHSAGKRQKMNTYCAVVLSVPEYMRTDIH